MKYELPELPYSYDALEPHIDAKTMEIHHTKHHAGYTKKLNDALGKHPDISNIPVEELLSDISKIPEDIRLAVINNGGGYINHKLFWEIMAPEGTKITDGDFKKALEETFCSIEDFIEQFSDAAVKRFGSGWVFLVVKEGEGLVIKPAQNQDSPLMQNCTPILALDVWEHAYYLKYQNKRGDYIKNWWNVVNWEKVEENYEKALS